MYLNEIEIENYKCFNHPTKLKLKNGINIIVGQNNVGKTSLFEALQLKFEDNPYLSVETHRETKKHNNSKITVVFTFTREELIDTLIKTRNQNNNDEYKFPLSRNPDLQRFEKDNFIKKSEEAIAKTEAKEYFSNENFTFRLFNDRPDDEYDNWQVPDDAYIKPSITKATGNNGALEFCIDFVVDAPDEFTYSEIDEYNVSSVNDGRRHRKDFVRKLGQPLHKYIYRFRAERIPYEVCSLGINKSLDPTASNLAEVLNLLNHTQLKRFNELVNEIFPNIYQVDVIKLDDSKGQVRVWNEKEATDEDDLGFTLDKCGSGVGQVLAILYVITTKEPKVILIDEPQSFLHPNAARKLIEIIRIYGNHHQIIIATHSPTIINSAQSSSVTLVTQNKGESILTEIDINEVEYQRVCCGELGISFSDVFGVDKIVWVEGKTEEICFNKIRNKFLPDEKRGVVILGVRNKSDFENADKNDRKRIVDIYEKLSSAEGGLMPKAVGYIFDSEGDDETMLDKIGELKPNHIHFTERRMYENYLLNPKAITAVINQIENLSGKNKVKTAEVTDWINQEKNRQTYFKPLPIEEKKWRDTIHGKRLLKELFEHFCSNHSNRNYKEKIHAVLLTEWILENSEKDFVEIVKLIEKAINNWKI